MLLDLLKNYDDKYGYACMLDRIGGLGRRIGFGGRGGAFPLFVVA